MYKAPEFSADGRKTGDRELPQALFDGTVHEAAMWQAVKAYLSNQRQANAATKKRGEVSGGNKKPWRQKGTGRARQGSIRSPNWRGGGVVFGPRPDRNHHEDVPRNVRRLARRSAFNVRAADESVRIIAAIELDAARTKRVVEVLKWAGAEGNILLLTDGYKPIVHLSARNLPNVQVRPLGEESAYDLLWADTLVIEAPALERAAEVAHA
jgi:large subunit ribosomal protein L4